MKQVSKSIKKVKLLKYMFHYLYVKKQRIQIKRLIRTIKKCFQTKNSLNRNPSLRFKINSWQTIIIALVIDSSQTH